MTAKTLPWWPKTLNDAMGGFRTGFGLFPRHPKLLQLEEEGFLRRLDEILDLEIPLTDHPLNPQASPAAPADGAGPVAVPEAVPAPSPVMEKAPVPEPTPELAWWEREPFVEAVPKVDATSVPEPAPKEEWWKEPVEDGITYAYTPFVDQPVTTADAAVAVEPAPVPANEPVEPATQAAPLSEEKPKSAPRRKTAKRPAAKPETPQETISIHELLAATEVVPTNEQIGPAMLAASTAPVKPKQPAKRKAAKKATAEPLIDAQADPAIAHVSVPSGEQIEPVTQAAPPPPTKTKAAPKSKTAKRQAAKPATPAEIVSIPEPVSAAETLPASHAPVDSPIIPVVESIPTGESFQIPTLVLTFPPSPSRNPAQTSAQKSSATRRRPEEAGEFSPFSVSVSQIYDGPLDLLLDLIRKQDIDIYDIPIAKITAQFLAYVNQLKASDVDVAGEFIYTASLLIHIKSKMLLPRSPSGPDDAPEDPRRELVERLLEHERFKNAAQMLQQKQMLEAATWSNPGSREFQDDAAAEAEIAADTVDLVRVFRDILERARNRPVIDVEEDTATVGQMIRFLGRRLAMEDRPVALRSLLSHTRSEKALVAIFLALLELVRLQAILLRQDRAFSDIYIKKHSTFDAVMNEGLANARDDWR